MKNKLLLKDISLSGIFIGLIIILNLFCSFFPILFGYSIDAYIVVFSFGLIILKTNIVKYSFFAFVPVFLLLSPNIYWINIWQVMVEYFLAIWCFFPFLFANHILKEKKFDKMKNSMKLFVFSILFIFCWLLKLFLHIVAGYFWWTNQSWLGSLLINLPIIILNIVLTIPIFIIVFGRVIKISKTYYLNIWNDA